MKPFKHTAILNLTARNHYRYWPGRILSSNAK